MALHEDYEDQSFSEYNYENEKVEDLDKKKKVRRMLEDRLEKKRLKEEFKDEFNELDGDFDWSEFEK